MHLAFQRMHMYKCIFEATPMSDQILILQEKYNEKRLTIKTFSSAKISTCELIGCRGTAFCSPESNMDQCSVVVPPATLRLSVVGCRSNVPAPATVLNNSPWHASDSSGTQAKRLAVSITCLRWLHHLTSDVTWQGLRWNFRNTSR